MKTNPTYFVGEESRRYLDALNVFQEFKNALLYALTENYGEQSGTDMYLSHNKEYEGIENIIWDYMRVPFTMKMGADLEQVEI